MKIKNILKVLLIAVIGFILIYSFYMTTIMLVVITNWLIDNVFIK